MSAPNTLAERLRPVPWWTRIEGPTGPVLHHDLTGRTLPLSPEADAAWTACLAGEPPPTALAQNLILRGFLTLEADPRPETVLQDRWPILARWAVFIHDGLGPLRVVERGAEGGLELRTLNPSEAFVWLNARGTVTTAELFDGLVRLGLDADAAADALRRWTHAHQQLVKAVDENINRRGYLPPHFYTLLHPPLAPGGSRLAPLLLEPAHDLGWRGLARTLAAGLAARGALRASPKAATVGPSAATLTDALKRARPTAAIAATNPDWPAAGPGLAHWQLDLVLGEFTAEAPAPIDVLTRLGSALAPGGVLWLVLPRAQAEAAAEGHPEARVEVLADWLPLPATPVLAGPGAWLDALDALVTGLGLAPLPQGPITATALRKHLDPHNPDTVHHLGFAPAHTRIGACPVADLAVLWLTKSR